MSSIVHKSYDELFNIDNNVVITFSEDNLLQYWQIDQEVKKKEIYHFCQSVRKLFFDK